MINNNKNCIQTQTPQSAQFARNLAKFVHLWKWKYDRTETYKYTNDKKRLIRTWEVWIRIKLAGTYIHMQQAVAGYVYVAITSADQLEKASPGTQTLLTTAHWLQIQLIQTGMMASHMYPLPCHFQHKKRWWKMGTNLFHGGSGPSSS